MLFTPCHFTSISQVLTSQILTQVIFIKAPLTSLIPRYSHTLARNNGSLRAVSLIISLVFMAWFKQSRPFDTQLEAPGCLAVLLDTIDLFDFADFVRTKSYPHHCNANR